MATISAGLVAPAVIEISGLPALLLLLAPFAILLIVIVCLRGSRPSPPPVRESEMQRAIPAAEELAPAPATAGSGPAPIAEPSVDWPARIKSAESAGDHAALAVSYLSFARTEIADGRHKRAAEHLRSSIRAATKSRNAAVQAEARLELAELARASGDLTTACEHWQIARALFHDLKRESNRDETERLMQQHGCPTDWVLNDF